MQRSALRAGGRKEQGIRHKEQLTWGGPGAVPGVVPGSWEAWNDGSAGTVGAWEKDETRLETKVGDVPKSQASRGKKAAADRANGASGFV